MSDCYELHVVCVFFLEFYQRLKNLTMENSADVKIETKGERKPRKQSQLSKGGKSVCRAVGYITGDMKEFGAWLKGKAIISP